MKNIAVCCGMSDESLDLIRAHKNHEIFKNAQKVHFIHCFEIQIYTSEFSPYIFPTEEKYPEIEKSTLSILKNLANDVLADPSKATFQCFFSHTPQDRVTEFLEDVKADMALVATRGKKGIEGLFSSSFAEHMVKYSPCDVFIMRPKKG